MPLSLDGGTPLSSIEILHLGSLFESPLNAARSKHLEPFGQRMMDRGYHNQADRQVAYELWA